MSTKLGEIAAAQGEAQFASRGLRNAPVKKTRARWTMIAAANISAAQW